MIVSFLGASVLCASLAACAPEIPSMPETPRLQLPRDVVTQRPRPFEYMPLYTYYAALQALDMHSTYAALKRSNTREGNAFLRPIVKHPVVFGLTKAAGTAAVIWAAERVRKKNRWAGTTVLVGLNVAMAVIIASNYNLAGKAPTETKGPA